MAMVSGEGMCVCGCVHRYRIAIERRGEEKWPGGGVYRDGGIEVNEWSRADCAGAMDPSSSQDRRRTVNSTDLLETWYKY